MKRITTIILYILYTFHIIAQNKYETDSICAMWVDMDIPHYGVRLHPIVKDKESLNDCLKSRVFYCQQSDDTLFVVSDTDIIFNNKLCNIENNWELKQIFNNSIIQYFFPIPNVLITNEQDSLMYIRNLIPEYGDDYFWEFEFSYSFKYNYRLVAGKIHNFNILPFSYKNRTVENLLNKLNIVNLDINNIKFLIFIHPEVVKNFWCEKYCLSYNSTSFYYSLVAFLLNDKYIESIYITNLIRFDVFNNFNNIFYDIHY